MPADRDSFVSWPLPFFLSNFLNALCSSILVNFVSTIVPKLRLAGLNVADFFRES